MTEKDRAAEPRAVSSADDDFDKVYSEWVRAQSRQHWTPIEVATRAASLLMSSSCTRVLDVGSGAGKFCVVGALSTPHGSFYGIEQRADLIQEARAAARQYGVGRRVQFIQGDITSIDWREFNAFYFFNPFCEPVSLPLDAAEPVGKSVQFGEYLSEHYIRFTRTQLAAAPSGTRVVTYYGFGGKFPPGYHRVRREGRGTGFVELWIKQHTDLWAPPFDPEAEREGAA